MSEFEPNEMQQRLIENTDGIYLVDAGPGTGKTFTITHRYAAIVDQPDIDPEDVLLVTFTRNAATEMKERIVDQSGYGIRSLTDAPIQTFHSFCHDLLDEYGYRAPSYLGLDHPITGSTQVIEDDLIAAEYFEVFFEQFRDAHPEHAEFYRILDGPMELRNLIAELTAKGVFPTAEGWYRTGDRHLNGDIEAFEGLFQDVNTPEGNSQSPLRADLQRYGTNKTYLPDAPSKERIRGERGTKRLDASIASEVFDEDRAALTSFVHNVYFEYLDFALERNYLTFGFLQLFAFVLLCEDPTVREQARFEYTMIDEFQDTSEIQFKLALLVAGEKNFCVVGDWKQSIYGFQYADVKNITTFETRIERFRSELNGDDDRVVLPTGPVERLELVENYRSTQTLLEYSEQALRTRATKSDALGEHPDIVSLSSNATFDRTRIRGVTHTEEPEAILSLVQEIVDNPDYPVESDDGESRPPEYRDIAVFTRTRDFGRELLKEATAYNVPMAYDGGVALFRTDAAKLLLAWLRILHRNGDRGWALVLEEAGYTLDEIDHLLEANAYPEEMTTFRENLASLETIGGVARRVFERYGLADAKSDALLNTVQSLYDTTTLVPGDLIRLLERGIEEGSVREVNTSTGANAVTVQTIHAAKGLEYPIVILANMNDGKFPSRGGSTPTITFDDPVGIRQRKVFADVGAYPHVFDNWRTDIIRHCLGKGYDEECRLLYVAITRAEHHLLFTCGDNPNTFFEELIDDPEPVEPDITSSTPRETEQTTLPFAIGPPTGPIGHSPHSLMDASTFEGESDAVETDAHATESGLAHGAAVHTFAEAYALGRDVEPETADGERVARLLDSLEGDKRVEEPVHLPLTVDGRAVVLSGVVDLVHELPDRVEIIDYKTDATRDAESEYKIQLSIYFHVLSAWFERPVTAELFYAKDDERVRIDPLSMKELEECVREHFRSADGKRY